ncbi:hypothetical protein KRR40_05415 [Niabella defluvii]|nr:hypothetical protein KRR40_05415 [Niabella sp. I65]
MEKLKRIIVKVLKAIFIRKKIAASKTIEQPVRHKHDQISRDRTASTGRPIPELPDGVRLWCLLCNNQ